MGPTDSIRDLIEPLVSSSGLEMWDIEVSSGLVRILVDRQGGIDLDDLGQLTERISAALDSHDELTPSGHYSLEVSSPGVERKLRTPDQFRRYVGTPVSVKTAEPIDGSRRTKGVLETADEAAISLRPDLATEPVRVPYAQIQTAHTVLEWGPAPKPGQPGSRIKTKDAAR